MVNGYELGDSNVAKNQIISWLISISFGKITFYTEILTKS